MANSTLTLAVIKSLKGFIESTKREVKLTSRLGRFLLEYQDIGNLDDNASVIRFSAAQKHQLEQVIRQDIGDWIFTQELENIDRLGIAHFHSNEKLASVKPNDQYVLVKSNTPISCLKSPTVDLPFESSLRIPIKLIDFTKLEQIVVVENQVAFDQIHLAKLPQLPIKTLFVYRGHDSYSSGCKMLLNQLGTPCEVTAFCDYDPQGMAISLQTINVNSVIVPTLTASLLSKNQLNDFTKQQQSFAYLNKQSCEVMQSHIDNINTNKLSLKQEHMIALAIPLILIRL